MHRPIMQGGSSATKEEPAKSGPPRSLLGATGGTEGGACQDDQATDPIAGSWTISPATATIAKECADGRSTVY